MMSEHKFKEHLAEVRSELYRLQNKISFLITIIETEQLGEQ